MYDKTCTIVAINTEICEAKLDKILGEGFINYQTNISKSTAVSAIRFAKLKDGLVFKNGYDYLHSLKDRMVNLEAIISMEVNKDQFKRIFVSWKALKSMFVYLRKKIVVDATFLSGPNKGTLITATLQDRNNSLIIMAFAIVQSKNTNAYV
ncbi:hypothetical protein CDIK_3584 [Cucumispora dikerogammari]|nr:hypothetical protein CDIK_3584 [Cucumispora dikerogammari]